MMTGIRTVADVVRFLNAVGQETRLKVIRLLLSRTLCVCEIEEILGMSQPAISQHLRVLRNAGLIDQKKDGQWIFCSINKEALDKGLLLVQRLFSSSVEDLPAIEALLERADSVVAHSRARVCGAADIT